MLNLLLLFYGVANAPPPPPSNLNPKHAPVPNLNNGTVKRTIIIININQMSIDIAECIEFVLQ